MSFIVQIKPQAWQFAAAPEETLLAAAERGGLRLPSSCRNGTCRTCLCRLTEGRVHHRIEWLGLSREEIAEGYILPCVAIADSDLVLEAHATLRLTGVAVTR